MIFVSESSVTEKEISAARELMLPDKFYSYKDLPACSGCRGCEKESDNDNSNKLPTSVVNLENKPTSGVFNFNNFSIPATPTKNLFGGNTKLATTISNVTVPNTQNIFRNTSAPVFGSGMIFGSKAQTLFNSPASTVVSTPSFTDSTQNEKYFETIAKPFSKTDVFGTRVQLTASNNSDQVVTTTASSGLLEKLLASSGTPAENFNSENNQNKASSFWNVKTPFSFGKIDTKGI